LMVRFLGLEFPCTGIAQPWEDRRMMKRIGLGAAMCAAVLALAVGAVVAGEHGKCTKSAEECAAMMKEKYQARGWMGVEMDHNEDGSVRITSVVPDSPAEKAGLKADDTLVSINGAVLSKDTIEKVMMNGDDWKIGNTLALGVNRGGNASTVKVTLARIPDTILAKMIETHTREYHEVAKN
jgi:C-terminal processing protease CtpA/Prc